MWHEMASFLARMKVNACHVVKRFVLRVISVDFVNCCVGSLRNDICGLAVISLPFNVVPWSEGVGAIQTQGHHDRKHENEACWCKSTGWLKLVWLPIVSNETLTSFLNSVAITDVHNLNSEKRLSRKRNAFLARWVYLHNSFLSVLLWAERHNLEVSNCLLYKLAIFVSKEVFTTLSVIGSGNVRESSENLNRLQWVLWGWSEFRGSGMGSVGVDCGLIG